MKPIYTMDFETDPFEHGRNVEPFAVGLYDGKDFDSVWSASCATKIVERIKKLPDPSIIYMHNGGRFDIFFIIQDLTSNMVIINGRIVQAWIGAHEIRDSYAILPMALAKYKKDDIDIQKLHRSCRKSHRVEILSYLRGDCVYLHELVTAFYYEFGDYLTIGSAAMAQLRKFHPFTQGTKMMDEKFRKTFFFGGRVQCFKSGVIHTPFKIHDVNSMYPHVMKSFLHPTGKTFEVGLRVTRKTAFVVAQGRNYGAFPQRNRQGGIDFTGPHGTFACTIHEWNTALELGMFKPIKVLKVYNFDQWMNFDEFVTHFFEARSKAKVLKDKIHDLFYKLILNSAYGKFAQNPDNFADYAITQGQRLAEPWSEKFVHNQGQYVIWEKPVMRHSYYHIATGASITGAARSLLLRGIHAAKNLIYCDTDSIISSELNGVALSDVDLGAWKLEANGSVIAIAGKKLYACFSDRQQYETCVSENGKDTDFDSYQKHCIKLASKGARISPAEIVDVALGHEVTFNKAAPTFKLNGDVQWISRRIKKTV